MSPNSVMLESHFVGLGTGPLPEFLVRPQERIVGADVSGEYDKGQARLAAFFLQLPNRNAGKDLSEHEGTTNAEAFCRNVAGRDATFRDQESQWLIDSGTICTNASEIELPIFKLDLASLPVIRSLEVHSTTLRPADRCRLTFKMAVLISCSD